MSLVTDLCGVCVGGGGVGGHCLGPKHHGDPGVGEVPGHGDAAVQGAVTGLAVFREEAHVTQAGGGCGAGYNVNIHSAPMRGMCTLQGPALDCRLLSPALSPQWPGRAGQRAVTGPAAAVRAGPDQSTTADTQGDTGEHVIF